MSGGLDFGGDWAYAFEAVGTFRCFAVVSGQCWLSIADDPTSILLRQGEFFALPRGRDFVLASDPTIEPRSIDEESGDPMNGRILQLQGGGGCCIFGAVFTFKGDIANHLLDVLPPVIHISDGEDRAALKSYLDRMMALLRKPQPGSVLVGENLAKTMLIEILRLYLVDGAGAVGWISALSDGKLSRAITAMHERPGLRWTVQHLAEHAGMSRSAFAVRFKEKVGVTVIEYLIRWRMLLAADRLRGSSDSVATIGQFLGYDSESAFVFAFRRTMGCTPRQYARRSARV